jgi:FlaA1/EpsC-like NDP-sugar epimerase
MIFSRDELKQYEIGASGFVLPSLRYFIGDMRAPVCLRRGMNGVHIAVYAAALK